MHISNSEFRYQKYFYIETINALPFQAGELSCRGSADSQVDIGTKYQNRP